MFLLISLSCCITSHEEDNIYLLYIVHVPVCKGKNTPPTRFFSNEQNKRNQANLREIGGRVVVGYKEAYNYKNGMVGSRNKKAGKGMG